MTELLIHRKYGYRFVAPESQYNTEFYKMSFYEDEKPEYLEKTNNEYEYWAKLWSLRLELMSNEIGKPGRILDIGAGGGFFLRTAKSCGWSVCGVEPSELAVEYSRQNFKLNIDQAYFEQWVARSESFDAIHMAFVLEHIPEPVKFVDKAINHLKRGGVMWIEVPNDFNPLQKAIVGRLRKNEWWIVPRHHLNYFNFRTLSSLLKDRGLDVIDQLSSFPMEMFPLMGVDYIGNDQKGKQAHAMRIEFEQNLLGEDSNSLLSFYRSLALSGLGRTCNILARKTL
jgi:2-polyprenyl-3-methyl-5-hydroxy-6-metoxy-1,4-benzoquinol methylase